MSQSYIWFFWLIWDGLQLLCWRKQKSLNLMDLTLTGQSETSVCTVAESMPKFHCDFSYDFWCLCVASRICWFWRFSEHLEETDLARLQQQFLQYNTMQFIVPIGKFLLQNMNMLKHQMSHKYNILEIIGGKNSPLKKSTSRLKCAIASVARARTHTHTYL